MQVGDKIYVYEIKLDFNNSKTEQICNIHKIIGVNEQKLVIDDYHFTVIKHKKAYSGDKEKLLNDVLFVDFTDWDTIDLIIVPALGYDRQGNRIGRGGGYYDRLLPQLKATKIGVCFPFQLVDKVPTEEFDSKVDRVIYR